MDITVPGGGTATFVCVGQGYGLVDVMWFRGNIRRTNPPPERSTVTTMITADNITIISILIVPDVNDDTDYTPKTYRCRYSNSQGHTDSMIARLTIGCKYLLQLTRSQIVRIY